MADQITRAELRAVFSAELDADLDADGKLTPCEEAAITDALEFADCDDAQPDDASADRQRVAEGLERFALDLKDVASVLRLASLQAIASQHRAANE